LAHGAIHLSWLAPRPEDDKSYPFRWRSVLLLKASEPTLRVIGTALIVLQMLAYLVAALGLFGVPVLAGMWGAAAILGSVLSMMVMALLWHPWFVAGPFVNVAIVAVVLLGWIK
jgi:hypothetical protein